MPSAGRQARESNFRHLPLGDPDCKLWRQNWRVCSAESGLCGKGCEYSQSPRHTCLIKYLHWLLAPVFYVILFKDSGCACPANPLAWCFGEMGKHTMKLDITIVKDLIIVMTAEKEGILVIFYLKESMGQEIAKVKLSLGLIIIQHHGQQKRGCKTEI